MKKSHPGVSPQRDSVFTRPGHHSGGIGHCLSCPSCSTCYGRPHSNSSCGSRVEPIPTSTPAVQQPAPAEVKKEDPEPGTSSVIGHAIVLKRPAVVPSPNPVLHQGGRRQASRPPSQENEADLGARRRQRR